MKFLDIFVIILGITLVLSLLNLFALACFNECSYTQDKGLLQISISFFMLEAAISIFGPIIYIGYKQDARDERKAKELL